MILAPTEYTKTMFLKSGFKPDQVWFLPYGVEAESPLTRVIRTGSPHTRFVFVGRLQPYKGAHLLIEAFNSLESPNGATLTIFGSADGHEEYFEHLQEISAGNQAIRLPGTLAQAEIWRAYAEADYFVLPSTWNENSPFVLLEALQSGTPIIASNIGGVTDLVRHADNGFLFPVGDVGALRQVLQQAIDYPELKERLRPRSELFTVDEYVKTIVSWATAVDSPVVNSEAVAAHS